MLAFLLRVDHLLAVSFWFDEACSWRISQFDWPELFAAVRHDAHPPLFYLLQKGWQSVWGTSVLSARSLSLCCGLGAVVAMVVLATTLRNEVHSHEADPNRSSSKWLPWGAGICLACSPLQISLSQQARPYALAVLLSLLAAICLMRAIRTPGSLWSWLAFSMVGGLLSFTHYFGLFTLLALFVFALLEVVVDRSPEHRPENRFRIVGLAGSAACLQLAWWNWIPTFQLQSARTLAQFWLPLLTWEHWENVVTEAITARSFDDSPAISWGVLPIWMGIPVLAAMGGGRPGRLAACGAGIPLLGLTAYSLCTRNILEPRLLCSAQAFLCLGLMLVVARLPSRTGRTVCLGGVSIGLLMLCGEYSAERNWHANHAGLRQAMDSLSQLRQADEPVIVSTPFLFASLVSQSQSPEQIFVAYQGDHCRDVLAGPPLLKSDYENVPTLLHSRPATFWTVDAERVFDGTARVVVPEEYRPAGQWRLAESYGIPMEIVVRRYQLPASTPLSTGPTSGVVHSFHPFDAITN